MKTEELLIQNNNIVGSIPNSVCNLQSMKTLWVDCSVTCSCCTHCN